MHNLTSLVTSNDPPKLLTRNRYNPITYHHATHIKLRTKRGFFVFRWQVTSFKNKRREWRLLHSYYNRLSLTNLKRIHVEYPNFAGSMSTGTIRSVLIRLLSLALSRKIIISYTHLHMESSQYFLNIDKLK